MQGEWAARDSLERRVIRLAVRVARADAEAVLAELLELAPGGLEERELGAGRGRVRALRRARRAARAAGPARRGRRRARRRLDDARSPTTGRERWKAFHPPVDVSWRFRRLRVRPPWEPPLDGDGVDLVIDPGQAFGTGAHHTTRLCLELLLELEPGGALADWGCGSGVLAIAAARLGCDPVLACDSDPVAVEATRANAAANGVPAIAVARCDLRRAAGPVGADRCRQPRAAAAARRRRR